MANKQKTETELRTPVITRFEEDEFAALAAAVERSGLSQNTLVRLVTMVSIGRTDLADRIQEQHAEVDAIIGRAGKALAKKVAGARR